MSPELQGWLSILVPSALAVLGVWISSMYLRRSNKEGNNTNAFQAVTDQLFKLNAGLTARVEELDKELKQVKVDMAAKDERIERLEDELEDTDKKWRRQINVTRLLANYIKRLISHWPSNVGPPPAPEPPMDWEAHL